MEKINQVKRKRFLRVAESRCNKILLFLKRLNNCTNRSAYQFFQFDIEKIFGEIERKVKIVKSNFENSVDDSDLKSKIKL